MPAAAVAKENLTFCGTSFRYAHQPFALAAAGLFSKEAVRRNCVLLYITHHSQVAAYIVYTTNGLAAHIAKLAVRDDLRRQGLGRTLVQAAVETARRERRVGSCSLHVDPANTAAVGLYRSLGFAVEAELQVGGGALCVWQ